MSRKKFRLDRRARRVLSRRPAHCCKYAPRFAREVLLWFVFHPCGVPLLRVTTPVESGNIGKRVLVSSVSTMVLSEAEAYRYFW